MLPVELWEYHSFTGVGPVLLLELSMPCQVDDNYFENTTSPSAEMIAGGNPMRVIATIDRRKTREFKDDCLFPYIKDTDFARFLHFAATAPYYN